MKLYLSALAAGCLFASLLPAQETRGQIIGRVTDATGAVLVGAQVKGVNSETNVAAAAATNHTGDYTLPFLIPGTYILFVEMGGFRRFEQTGIRVQVDDKVAINVTLQLGGASETVEVVADSPLIDAADGTLSSVVDSRSATELPLKDGNPMMLVGLKTGVVNLSENGATRPFDNNNSSAMAIGGNRSGNNEYRIDEALPILPAAPGSWRICPRRAWSPRSRCGATPSTPHPAFPPAPPSTYP